MAKKNYTDAKSILDMGEHRHIIFTDGSCYPNNRSIKSRAGYSACFVSGPMDDTIMYGNIDMSEFYASNIRAEGVAIIRSLEHIYHTTSHSLKLNSGFHASPWLNITLVTDCEFWIKMVENYMPNWDKTKFKESKNPDLTKRLWSIYNLLLEKGSVVKFMHVKSHNKDGWREYRSGTLERYCYVQNDYVDKLCSFARLNVDVAHEIITTVLYED